MEIKDTEHGPIVQIDKEQHPIKWGNVYEHEGYRDRTYTFTDEMGKEANGVLVEFEPGAATPVIKVVHDEVVFKDVAIEGAGWFLGIEPGGDVVSYEVGPKAEINPLIKYGQGWVFCWISGSDGMKVLDVTTPPFQPSMEIIMEEDSPELPQTFWQKRAELIRRARGGKD